VEHKDWKTNIGDYLGGRNIYRIGYLNKQLEAIGKEWTAYIQQFDGVEANSSVDYLPYELKQDSEGKYIYVSVRVRSMTKEYFPFKVSLYFVDNLRMVINYPSDFSVKRRNYPFKEMSEDFIDCDEAERRLKDKFMPDFYDWKTETLDGPEIHENRYIFQILNNRFTEWMDHQLSE